MTRRPFSAALMAAAIMTTFSANVCGEEIGSLVQQNLDTLIRTNVCPDCDLSGVDLNRMNLSGADLKGADLSGASFFLADLSGADLSGANLRGAKFGGADLAGTDLREADLRGALLDGAYIEGTIMDGIVLEKERVDPDVDEEISQKVFIPDQKQPKEISEQNKAAVESEQEVLEAAGEELTDKGKAETPGENRSDQQKSDPPNADMSDQKDVEMSKMPQSAEEAPPAKAIAPIEKADVGASDAMVGGANDIQSPSAENLSSEISASEPAEMVEERDLAEAADTDMNDAAVVASDSAPSGVPAEEIIEKLLDRNRCYGCNLRGANLAGKNLGGADLEGADLSGAVLNDADLAGANLKGALLIGAQLINADLRKADLYKADLSSSDLTDTDFRGAEMDEADFTGATGYHPSVMLP